MPRWKHRCPTHHKQINPVYYRSHSGKMQRLQALYVCETSDSGVHLLTVPDPYSQLAAPYEPSIVQ